MKTLLILFFILFNYSFVLSTSVLLELDKFITTTIISDSSMSRSEKFLYVSIENGLILVLSLNIMEEKINQDPISFLCTSSHNHVIFSMPDDRYLIVVGDSIDDSNIQIMNIFDLKDKYNPKNVSTPNFTDTSIQSMDFLLFTKVLVLIDKNHGIYFLNLTDIQNPYLLPRNNFMKINGLTKSLILKNETLLAVVGKPPNEYNYIAFFNISDLYNVSFLNSVIDWPPINAIASLNNDQLIWIKCIQAWDGYIVSANSSVFYDGVDSEYIFPLFCDLVNPQLLVPSKDGNLLFYTTGDDTLNIYSYPGFQNSSFRGTWGTKIHMMANNYFVMENKDEGNLKLYSFFEIDDNEIPYSLVQSLSQNITDVFESDNLTYSSFISVFPINNGKNLMACVYYYFLYQNYLPSVIFNITNDYMHLEYFSSVDSGHGYYDFDYVNYGSLDKKGRYYILIGFSYMYNMYQLLIFDNQVNNVSALGGTLLGNPVNNAEFSFRTVQFDDILYIMPYVWNGVLGDFQYFMSLNISNPTNVSLQNTNIPSDSKGMNALGSCLHPYGDQFIFYKYWGDPYLKIVQVNNRDYNQLDFVSQVYVGIKIKTIEASDDCSFLYIGGSGFYVLNITDINNPHTISTLWIYSIFTLNRVRNRIYLMTDIKLYVINVANPLVPKIMYDSMYPTDQAYKMEVFVSGVINTQDANYIYRGSNRYDSGQGNKEIFIFKEKKSPFYLQLKTNIDLIVGVPITYRYFCIYIKTLLEIKGTIDSIYLVNSTNYSLKQGILSWIELDSNMQTLTITVPKIYMHYRLSLVFSMKSSRIDVSEIYEQTISFDFAKGSLNLIFNDSKAIIQTPVEETSIQIEINYNTPENVSMKLIKEDFSGVFILYSEKDRKFVATGLKSALNSMLGLLRYTISPIQKEEPTIDIIVQDYINENLIVNNLTRRIFNRNNPPEFSIQSILSMRSVNITILPTVKFEYQLSRSWFTDADGDQLTFSVSLQVNATKIGNEQIIFPNWLTFDSTNLKFTGTPTKADEGVSEFFIEISDGYDPIYQIYWLEVHNDPPKKNYNVTSSFLNSKIAVGEEFSFTIDSNIFSDDDGPNKLAYSVFVSQQNKNQFRLTPGYDYWLKFDDQGNKLFGNPTFADCQYDKNNIVVEIKADDGVDYASFSLTLQINPSLTMNYSESVPIIQSFDNNVQIQAIFEVTEGKILLTQSFKNTYPNDIQYQTNTNMNQITITTANSEIMNKAFPNILYRGNNTNHRILSGGNPGNFSLTVKDSLNQNFNYNLSLSLIQNSDNHPIRDESLISNSYFGEIGKDFRLLVDKNIMRFNNSQMSLVYSLTILNSKKEITNWLSIEQGANLEIYSGKNLDDSLLGSYQAIITMKDEFGETYNMEFDIDVDFSVAEKIRRDVQLISTIVGPTISILAVFNFFYLIYNCIWKNKFSKKDYYLKIDVPFKYKIPLIKQEYEKAFEIFNKLKTKVTQKNTKYFQSFLTEDILNICGSLTSQNDFMTNLHSIKIYSNIKGKSKETIDCLIEGLLVKHLIELFPQGNTFFKLFEREAHKINASSDYDEWYDQFFFNQYLVTSPNPRNIISESKKSPISNYVLVQGIYAKIEKNSWILNEWYDEVFKVAFKDYKCKTAFKETEKMMLKPLVMRTIISIKRGIPFGYSNFSIKLNKICCSLGFRFLPFAYGDSLHLSDEEVKKIVSYLKIEEEPDLNGNKNKLVSKVLDFLGSGVKMNKYFSVNNKSIPNWLKVRQRKGFLSFSGAPWREEINKKYLIYISSARGFSILKFWLKITDVTHAKIHEQSILQQMSVLKTRNSIENTELAELNHEISNRTSTLIGSNRTMDSSSDRSLRVSERNQKKIKKSTFLTALVVPKEVSLNFGIQNQIKEEDEEECGEKVVIQTPRQHFFE